MTDYQIPTVNVDKLYQQETLRSLDAACRNWGTFQIVGHGIDVALIKAVHAVMHRFFAQPIAAKRALSRSFENPWGFYDRELTKNTRDWKEVFDYGPADGEGKKPQWPRGIPHFRETLLAYYDSCEKLAFRILKAVACNLGVPDEELVRHFFPQHTSFLRLNYYPECPAAVEPENADALQERNMGVHQHTDAGVLTILLQDKQPGLEVYQNQQWHLVRPYAEALVVNLGDIVQVWSNDRYPAPLHRVITHADAKRYTVPFFFNPAYSAEYQPLSATIDAQHPARYRAVSWGEFRRKRAMGDYADLGEEVEISHYRL